MSFIVVKLVFIWKSKSVAFNILQTDCLWYIFSGFFILFNFEVLTTWYFQNTAICVAFNCVLNEDERERPVYSEMLCIFPLILTTIKEIWKVEIYKDLGREFFNVKEREESDKKIKDWNLEKLYTFTVFLWWASVFKNSLLS